jgi:hypothetical protein
VPNEKLRERFVSILREWKDKLELWGKPRTNVYLWPRCALTHKQRNVKRIFDDKNVWSFFLSTENEMGIVVGRPE